MTEIEYWIWASLVFGPGSLRGCQIIDKAGGPEKLYKSNRSERAKAFGMTDSELRNAAKFNIDDAKYILHKTAEKGFIAISPDDSIYPDRLRSIRDWPLVLYVSGQMPDFDQEVAIAIVGTRQMTPYGHEMATRISYGLSAAGAVVVSGLAMGIDTAAHKGALKAGGRTVAVVGTGLDLNYPAQNSALKKIISENSAVISEYPIGTQVKPFHFHARNRIISGLCLGTVVVEAKARSGSLITATHALNQGRDVFAVVGNANNSNSEGTYRLLRDNAIPVRNALDVLSEYFSTYPHKLNMLKLEDEIERAVSELKKDEKYLERVKGFSNPVTEPSILKQRGRERDRENNQGKESDYSSYPPDSVNGKIISVLGTTPLYIDEIVAKTGLAPPKISSALTELEMDGVITIHSGKRYSLK